MVASQRLTGGQALREQVHPGLAVARCVQSATQVVVDGSELPPESMDAVRRGHPQAVGS